MQAETNPITRRQFLSISVASVALLSSRSLHADPPSTQATKRYRISACDWMMLKRQKPGALTLAKDCGLDGVELDMGGLGKNPDFKNELKNDEFRTKYQESAQSLGIEISSLAMSAFFGQAWAVHPSADKFAADWIGLMELMKIRIGFLPLGVGADIEKDPSIRPGLVEHLKLAAPLAEKAGVIIGLGGALSVDESKRLLDDIGSTAVKMYYHLGDQMEKGRDIYADIRALGTDRICQIHFSETDGAWLGDGKIDLKKSKEALDEIGYSGWLVLERSRVEGKKPKENFSANCARLKAVFQA
jgi:sugar phosphate isomerase/epimerase